MNKMQRITAIAILALSIFGIWSSVTHSQDEGSRRRSPADREARKDLPRQTPHAGMSAEAVGFGAEQPGKHLFVSTLKKKARAGRGLAR